jgi:hypothetical protein
LANKVAGNAGRTRVLLALAFGVDVPDQHAFAEALDELITDRRKVSSG